ncbi:MAG: hypothetical protein K8R87_10130 [Verrucomicrobia bacterium]|nr:hypothetical protein [Verrucomicrobiota bacterium]
MKAIHLLAPATLAISAALNPAHADESTSVASVTTADGCRAADSRKPVLMRTEFISSARERRILGCDDCGNLFSFYVTVITLQDVFSDGTTMRRLQTVDA